jgi:hypothetical protein
MNDTIPWTYDGLPLPRTPLPEVTYLDPIAGLLAWVEAGGAL